MDVGAPRSRPLKPRAAGAFEGAIGSFRLNLAAEGKSPKTVRMYTEAVQWFAAAHLLREACRADWDEVDGQDIRRWIAWLLSRYSDSYARTSTGPSSSSSAGGPERKSSPTPWRSCIRPRSPRSSSLFHQRRTIKTGAGLRGQDVRSAPGRRDHLGVPGDRHPGVGAGRDPV